MAKYDNYSTSFYYQGVMYRPTAGLNEYTPAIELSDNHVSDCLDLDPYRDRALQFNTVGINQIFNGSEGVVRAAIPSYGAEKDSGQTVMYVLVRSATGWSVIKATDTLGTVTKSVFALTNNSSDADASSCVFNTQAERYYCFVINNENRLHYIREVKGDYGYVDLPFLPNKMVVHANRIFIVSDNILWWCRAGDLFSWYSEDYKEAAISSEQPLKNGALDIDAQPNTARLITFTHRKEGDTDVLGTITISGEADGESRSETITLISSGMVVSARRYDTINSIVVSDWSAVGSPDKVTIGYGPIGSKYVQGDSGYWTIEREKTIYDMCVMSENIYLFGPHNIHVMQGYSYETFSLQQIIADVGLTKPVSEHGFGYSALAVVSNTIFFIYNNEVYSFDGHSRPMIISRPVIQNGGSVNAVFGGVSFTSDRWALAARNNVLYLYKTSDNPNYFYKYVFQTKTWWRYSGVDFSEIEQSQPSVLFVPSFDKSVVHMFVNNSNLPYWYMSNDNSQRIDDVYPYFVTKAFNTIPSEDSTLYNILLHVKGEAGTYADILISYSLDDDNNEFRPIKELTSFGFDGNSQVIPIYLPVAFVSRQHLYRLKVQIKANYPVYLYNIERRYRVHSRSR